MGWWKPMAGVRASRPGAANESSAAATTAAAAATAAADSSEMERDFDKAMKILQSRDDSLRAEIECDFTDDLTVKEVEKVELQARCNALERSLQKHRSAFKSLGAQVALLKQDRDEVCALVRSEQNKIARFLDSQKNQFLVAARRAREEIDVWKRKCADLEARIRWLEEERAGRIIEIIDSDDEKNAVKDHATHKSSAAMEIDLENVGAEEEDDEGSGFDKSILSTRTPKRKCVSRIVTSDSESDDEDKIPLSKLKMRRVAKANEEEDTGLIDSSGDGGMHEGATPTLKRLVTLRELHGVKSGTGVASPVNSSPQLASPNESAKRVLRDRTSARRKINFSDAGAAVEDEVRGGKTVDDDSDGESESEGESLGGFIVDNSDGSESECSSNSASEEVVGDDEKQSDSDAELEDVLAKIRREKKTKEWEYEADMLAAFGKDPKLCMKAVCALYKLQTSEEQSYKQSILTNKRGFNKLDAVRGSLLAEFISDGDPDGQLKKTVEELKKYDPTALEFCYKLATRYSGQLFMVYQNKTDPFFGPC